MQVRLGRLLYVMAERYLGVHGPTWVQTRPAFIRACMRVHVASPQNANQEGANAADPVAQRPRSWGTTGDEF